jgi:excinuclease ABC subunit C
MTVSALDGIPGLGDTRRKALMRRFGSLKRLRAATVDDIAEVPGIGPRTAAAIVAALSADSTVPAAPAVNVTTGEVVG